MRYLEQRNLLHKQIRDLVFTLDPDSASSFYDYVLAKRANLSNGIVFGRRNVVLKCLLFDGL